MDFANYYRSIIETLQKWGIAESSALAYGSTLAISLAPFLLLFLVRVENTPQHRDYLRVALSFASGGLLGDAFLHLIPHSMGHSHHHDHDHEPHHHHHDHGPEHNHDHEHHHHEKSSGGDSGAHDHSANTFVGLYIVSGIIIFFLLEKFIHFLKGDDGGHGHHQHSHTIAVGGKENRKSKLSSSEDDESEEAMMKSKSKSKKITNKRKKKTAGMSAITSASQTRIVSGFLNLIADFLHNFTDGLAIGATFAAGNTMGTITAFTIFMHEIPHEIGDYAILIQAGYRRRSAIALQLVTAIGALIGTAIGLRYGTLEAATQLILPITAGGFIYIATVTVLPELLEKRATSYRQAVAEIGAMLVGVAMMFWIALNE